MQYYIKALKQYADFNGRARRKEFWMFVLFNFIFCAVASIIDSLLFGPRVTILQTLYSLAVLVPSLAVGARRLHDTDRSGWWLLLWLIPIIGWIVLIVFAVQDSIPTTNKYGPNPKAGEAAPTTPPVAPTPTA